MHLRYHRSPTIGAALAPTIQELAETVTRVVVRVTEWLRQNKAVVVTALQVAAAVTAAGFALRLTSLPQTAGAWEYLLYLALGTTHRASLRLTQETGPEPTGGLRLHIGASGGAPVAEIGGLAPGRWTFCELAVLPVRYLWRMDGQVVAQGLASPEWKRHLKHVKLARHRPSDYSTMGDPRFPAGARRRGMHEQKKRGGAFCKVSALEVVAGLCLVLATVEARVGAWPSPLGPRPATSVGVGEVPEQNPPNDLPAALRSEAHEPNDVPCEPADPPPWEPCFSPPRVWPWFEFLGYSDEAHRLVAYCKSVAAWTDGVIVVTQPWHAWIYQTLAEEVPSLEIMPGARVLMFLGGRSLDDPAVWQDIAAYARNVLTVTGSRRFALEVEYPLYEYWEGDLSLNMQSLALGLSSLPERVDYLWYPGGLASPNQNWLADQEQRCLNLWRTIQSAVPSVTFAAAGPSNTKTFNGRPQQVCNDELLRSEGRQFMDSIYLTSDPGLAQWEFWQMNPVDAYQAVRRVRSPEAFVWTTDREWCILGQVMPKPLEVCVLTDPWNKLCCGDSVELTAEVRGGKPPYSYHWQQEISPGLWAELGTAPTQIVSPARSTNYRVVVEDTEQCQATSDPIELAVCAGNADLNCDEKVDMIDFARFQSQFTGP